MPTTVSTPCLFGPSSAKCVGPNREHLSMLICKKHLLNFYGLEMHLHEEDNATVAGFVGGFLRPVKNVAYFPRNTVIIPTKQFFDRTMRPEHFEIAHETIDYRKYQMNPIIMEYIRKYGMTPNKSVELRLGIEMYRNMMTDNVDTGPKQESYLHNLTALIRAKKSVSESYIHDQSIFKTLQNNALYVGNNLVPVNNATLALSISMQYLLYNCLFSEAEITNNSGKFIDYLHHNCEFIPEVGLVATEYINWPHPLVMYGKSSGSQIFYNAIISLIKKDVVTKKYKLNEIPEQYALTDALKSGSVC